MQLELNLESCAPLITPELSLLASEAWLPKISGRNKSIASPRQASASGQYQRSLAWSFDINANVLVNMTHIVRLGALTDELVTLLTSTSSKVGFSF
jgi:hypothetical protein